jgi:Icc-related predicted phosphoesterase
MKKIIVEEEEKNQISSQHEEVDSRLFNFLIRRLKVEERNLGGNWGDFEPMKIKEYSFEGIPGYGFTGYNTKKEMERKILNMLDENDIIDTHPYELDERDPERVKIIKTIRKFLNFVLSETK